jgi:hypothetical protein
VIDKPEKKETGRTKGAKQKSKDPKWKRAERSDAKFLETHAGVDDDPAFARLKSSTGRVGFLCHLGYDQTSQKCVGESKARKLPKWLTQSWVQLQQCAMGRKKDGVLFLHLVDVDEYFTFEGKRYRVPNPLNVITPERHAFLLACERELEELKAQLESTNASS